MKKNIFLLSLVIIIVVVAFGIWLDLRLKQQSTEQPGQGSEVVQNPPVENNEIPASPEKPADGLNFDQTVSDGTITISIPSSEFGLAVKKDQILVHSYIPPCDENFNYCLYYDGSAYKGTNFESAGLRIQKRDDLKTQSACLTTQPAGYNGLTPKTESIDSYATSVFSPLGDAGAGHYSSGSLYRLFYDNKCYEFQTRIGESQFANYPAGSIKEFTSADQSAVKLKLQEILNAITLPDGVKIRFPDN
jgi:hypothetical protein